MGFKAKQPKEKKQLTAEDRKKRNRNVVIVACILVVTTIACYWAMPKNNMLGESELFDENAVEAQAQNIISLINAEDYDSLQKFVVKDMEELMNPERMNEAKARISEDWGAFLSSEIVQSTEITQRGAHAAVVYILAQYENVEAHYTLAFNEDMKLASLGIQ